MHTCTQNNHKAHAFQLGVNSLEISQSFQQFYLDYTNISSALIARIPEYRKAHSTFCLFQDTAAKKPILGSFSISKLKHSSISV